MSPRAGRHAPTSMRASDDFPDALGPMMPRPLPALSAKATSCTTGLRLPGGTALAASTDRLARGRGNASGALRAGIATRSSFNRRQAWRAATKPFQLAIATSTGARAREVRIELAMMMPAEACCCNTR